MSTVGNTLFTIAAAGMTLTFMLERQVEINKSLCLKPEDKSITSYAKKFNDKALGETLKNSALKILLKDWNTRAEKLSIHPDNLAKALYAITNNKPEDRKIPNSDIQIPNPIELSYSYQEHLEELNSDYYSSDTICTKLENENATNAFYYANQPKIAAEIIEQWIKDIEEHAKIKLNTPKETPSPTAQ